jgi:hypothetical protein
MAFIISGTQTCVVPVFSGCVTITKPTIVFAAQHALGDIMVEKMFLSQNKQGMSTAQTYAQQTYDQVLVPALKNFSTCMSNITPICTIDDDDCTEKAHTYCKNEFQSTLSDAKNINAFISFGPSFGEPCIELTCPTGGEPTIWVGGLCVPPGITYPGSSYSRHTQNAHNLSYCTPDGWKFFVPKT